MSRKQIAIFKKVGQTEDGQDVVAGVYKFYETVGLPLADIFSFLQEQKCIPSWLHFCQEAIQSGMNIDRVISKLEEPLVDIYGGAFAKVVLNKLKNYSSGLDSSGFLAGPGIIINSSLPPSPKT